MHKLTYESHAAIMNTLNAISQGKTVTKACRECHVTVAVFLKTVRADQELAVLFDEAMQQGHDTLADALVDMKDLVAVTGAANEKEMSLASANIKWLLARRDQQRFGDTVTVTHNITADKAIVNALQRGMQRAIEQRVEKSSTVEDAAFEVVHDFDETEFL